MIKRFEVSGEWLAACGKGSEPKVFDVLDVREFRGVHPGFSKMLTVDDNGYRWVVAIGRGRVIEEE